MGGLPSTLPQQRWLESHGVLVRFTNCFSRRRCFAVELIEGSEMAAWNPVLHDFVLLEDLIKDDAGGVRHRS